MWSSCYAEGLQRDKMLAGKDLVSRSVTAYHSPSGKGLACTDCHELFAIGID